MSAVDMTALGTSLLQLADRLQPKGIRLIIMGYSDKSRIYSDMVPGDSGHHAWRKLRQISAFPCHPALAQFHRRRGADAAGTLTYL